MKKYIFSTAEKGLIIKGRRCIILSYPKGSKKMKGLYKLWKLVVEFPTCGNATNATATAFAPYAVTM